MHKRRIDIQMKAVAKASRSARPRGVVLILVVAVLGILFVAGAALLNTVTFSTKTLDAAKIDRENRAAVRAIESTVAELLRKGFLGPDGRPYNAPQSPNGLLVKTGDTARPWRVNEPLYGEIPGVNTWMSLTEPEEDGANCNLHMYTYLPWAIESRPAIDPDNANKAWNAPDGPLGRIDLHQLDGMYQNPLREPFQIMDADGDGIPDSYAMPITNDVLSPELRRALADRLRDQNTVKAIQNTTFVNNNPDFDPDTLWLSLKIVPHGAMVNLNTRMRWCGTSANSSMDFYDPLVASVLQYTPDVWHIKAANSVYESFTPESIEWLLRYRGGTLLPRSPAKTRLLAFEEIGIPLLSPSYVGSQSSPAVDEILNASKHQWWRHDNATLGDYNQSLWRRSLDGGTTDIAEFNISHLVTTISHDDQLIRSGFGPDPDMLGTSPGSQDWIEHMMHPAHRPNFEWDNYPHYLDDLGELNLSRGLAVVCGGASGRRDLRLGRLKFSFPYFSKNQKITALDACSGDGFGSNGWLPTGVALDGLDFANVAGDGQRLIRTIQDAFFLMLRNYAEDDYSNPRLPNGYGVPVFANDAALSLTAASLGANMIDFSDNDPMGMPTEVTVRDWRTGVPGNVKVYGLERQPFITELYAKFDPGPPPVSPTVAPTSIYAIELYNPYDAPISLTDYELVDQAAGDLPHNKATDGQPLGRLPSTALTGSIAGGPALALDDPSRFKVIYSSYGETPGVTSPVDLGEFGLDADSIITLVRNVDVGGTAVPVPVDRVDLGNGVFTRPDGTELSGPQRFGQVGDVSIQRDTTLASVGSNWRFVTPIAAEYDQPLQETLGAANRYDNPGIRSVHVDFANAGSLNRAFPTTGAMLLLMRHAHVVDPSDPDPPRGPKGVPFNHVGGLMAAEFDQIDNGRMPVFDTARRYHSPAVLNDDTLNPAVPIGAHQGVGGLPWGQLVFDYFTALPLRPGLSDDQCSGTPLPRVLQPLVEQDGMRVSGRININAAPWTVLAGLPVSPLDAFSYWPASPGSLRNVVENTLYGQPGGNLKRYWDDPGSTFDDITQPGVDGQPSELGVELARAIVAYRNAKPMDDTIPPFDLPGSGGDFNDKRGPQSSGTPLFRRGFGFLTVGELLNVQPLDTNAPTYWMVNMDSLGVLGQGDYVKAVSRMIALGDWVTTKSHVFTVYGTIRGQFYHDSNDPNDSSEFRKNSLKVVDQRAIRFQTTVDRLPMLFGQDGLTRIGSMMIGPYTDMSGK